MRSATSSMVRSRASSQPAGDTVRIERVAHRHSLPNQVSRRRGGRGSRRSAGPRPATAAPPPGPPPPPGPDLAAGVLVGVLGVDGLAGRERDVRVPARCDRRHLVSPAHQGHPDPPGVLVVDRPVVERAQVEVATQLPVDAGEQVLVEAGGHAPGVVVGRLEHGARLAQVEADQQPVVRPHRRPHLGEEGRGLRPARSCPRSSPATGSAAAGRAVCPVRPAQASRRRSPSRYSPHRRVDLQRRILVEQPAGRSPRARRGRCRSASSGASPAGAGGPRSGGGSCAALPLPSSTRAAPGRHRGDDLLRVTRQDLVLGPGQVVLGEVADLLEEP